MGPHHTRAKEDGPGLLGERLRPLGERLRPLSESTRPQSRAEIEVAVQEIATDDMSDRRRVCAVAGLLRFVRSTMSRDSAIGEQAKALDVQLAKLQAHAQELKDAADKRDWLNISILFQWLLCKRNHMLKTSVISALVALDAGARSKHARSLHARGVPPMECVRAVGGQRSQLLWPTVLLPSPYLIGRLMTRLATVSGNPMNRCLVTFLMQSTFA